MFSTVFHIHPLCRSCSAHNSEERKKYSVVKWNYFEKLSLATISTLFPHFQPFCVSCTWYLLSSSPIALPKWLQPLACSSSYSVLLFWLSGAFSSPQWKLLLNIYVQIKISLINNLNLLYFILKWTSIADRSRMREREWSTFQFRVSHTHERGWVSVARMYEISMSLSQQEDGKNNIWRIRIGSRRRLDFVSSRFPLLISSQPEHSNFMAHFRNLGTHVRTQEMDC